MLFFRAVDEDGIGGDDIDDFDIDLDEDEEGDNTKEKEIEKQDKPPEEGENELQKRVNELEAFHGEVLADRALKQVEIAMKKDYPSFDMDKIGGKLREIAKDNAELAEQYNNPAGFEAIHLKFFQQKQAEFDPFDAGRSGTQEPFNFDKAYEKLEKGDRTVVRDLIKNSR